MKTKARFPRAILAASVVFVATSGIASAETPEQGWFADLGAGASFRSATSDTTNGGATRTGTVSDVEFDTALTLGGRVGY